MNTRTAVGLLIGLAAIGCNRPGHKDQEGMGAGADTAGIRDTAVSTAAPAPAPVNDSVQQRTRRILDSTNAATASGTPRNQTQSGMKNKAGQSTLGPAVKRTRPDAGEPVMAKGDTLARSADQRATDSLNRAVLDRLNQQTTPTLRDSAITGEHDTMPQPRPVPPNPAPTDTTKPVPVDSTRPADSTRTPPPLPLDTMPRPIKDSTSKDSTKH